MKKPSDDSTDRLFAKYYERKNVTGIANAICTRTLAGKLSLWSVTANAISYGESGRDEAGMEHKKFIAFYKFSVTAEVYVR